MTPTLMKCRTTNSVYIDKNRFSYESRVNYYVSS